MSLFYHGYNTHKHGFHPVKPSLSPFLVSLYTFFLVTSGISYMHYYINGLALLVSNALILITLMFSWWSEIVTEATFEGHHTLKVQRGLRFGMLLFIISEIMFFFGFFWAFFHSSLSPAITIGGVWPPEYIETFSPWGLPLLNTIILLSSGASVTWAHYAICEGHWPQLVRPQLQKWARDIRAKGRLYRADTIFLGNTTITGQSQWPLYLKYYSTILLEYLYNFLVYLIHDPKMSRLLRDKYMIRSSSVALLLTVSFGILFLCLQGYEYVEAPSSLSDGIYGSTFYMLTGFHGFHVLVGTIFLIVCLVWDLAGHFTKTHHVGFEAAAWYWHFVDVVWPFLFIVVYWWGGN